MNSTSIPPKIREYLSEDPFMEKCSRKYVFQDHFCKGEIQWEHAVYYRGRKIQEKWAIIPLCRLVHQGGKIDKRKNEFIALHRAEPGDFEKYSAEKFEKMKKLRNNAFGEEAIKRVKRLIQISKERYPTIYG